VGGRSAFDGSRQATDGLRFGDNIAHGPVLTDAIDEAARARGRRHPDRLGARASRRDHRPRPQPRVQQGSAVLHGEMDALERAGRQPASVYREMRDLHDALAVRDVHRRDSALRHPTVVVGENQTFMGEEDLLRSRGVSVEVVQDERCTAMMKRSSRRTRSCGTRISGL
jgi:hypothetical protein